MKLVAACVLAALALATPAAAQPVEAFGRLPAVADVAISPDGRRIAVATSDASGGGAVMIIDVDEPSQRNGYSVGEDIQLRAVGWADNERVSYLLSQTVRPHQVLPAGFYFVGAPRRIDYFRWGTINITSGRSILLTTNPENAWADQGGGLISPIEGDPGYARMTGRSASLQRRREGLFRINLDNGRVRELAPSGVNEDTTDFVIDRAGRVVARLDSNEPTNRWRLWVYDGETPRLLIQDVSDFGEPPSVYGLLADGRLVASRYNDAGFSALYAIDRATGAVDTLHEIENSDVDGALIDPWTREVVGVTWTAIESEQHFFDADLEQVRLAIAQNLAVAFRVESWSQDRSRFIVYAESGMDGGTYHVFDRADSSLRMLTPRYPDLVRAPAGQRQSITYRARDGVRIPAYLTLPRDVEARNLPLVVLVHGGPHSRDTMDFDWWAAFLVSRGYAVLQPNFRGSSGYGQAWEEAGRRQWGGLMQTDVEDGAAALVRAGIADERRMCIVGASYGGYAALAGAALTPDRYSCAISVAGISDLIMMLTQTERQTGDDSSTSDWWRASIGDRQEDRERVRSVSPVFLADRVRVPVLLIHGTDDTVVPIEQSRRMLRALQAAGKAVRFVELRGDDHWLSDAPTRIQMLREIEAFLAQHLGAAAN